MTGRTTTRRNLIIWVIGFVLYRLLMNVDIIVGNTLPDMLITMLLCIVTELVIRSAQENEIRVEKKAAPPVKPEGRPFCLLERSHRVRGSEAAKGLKSVFCGGVYVEKNTLRRAERIPLGLKA